MYKEFKKLRGNRVYLEIPEQKDSSLILTEEEKAEIVKKQLSSFSKLKVYAVGDLVTDIAVGDVVLMDPAKLQSCLIIKLSEKKEVMLVSPFDIVHVW